MVPRHFYYITMKIGLFYVSVYIMNPTLSYNARANLKEKCMCGECTSPSQYRGILQTSFWIYTTFRNVWHMEEETYFYDENVPTHEAVNIDCIQKKGMTGCEETIYFTKVRRFIQLHGTDLLACYDNPDEELFEIYAHPLTRHFAIELGIHLKKDYYRFIDNYYNFFSSNNIKGD